MGGRRRNQGWKGGRHKEVVDLFRAKNTTAVWIPAVPSWERDYCKLSVGLPWKEFCEVKEHTICFPEVEKWNDSAAEEAFHLARRRYVAKINGTPCDIPEHDPDAYIDVIEWDSPISGDIDWSEGLGSDSGNEEKCANGNKEIRKLPDLDQEMTASEKERHEKEKSGWKERPFGYGRIYFPEIHEARTVICMVVDLYTAEPCVTDHWKVDLWSKTNNNENTIGRNAMQTGWSENEMELKNNSTDHVIEQKNGTVENKECRFPEGSSKKHPTALYLACNNNQNKNWGKAMKTGSDENEMEVIIYPKAYITEQKNETLTHAAQNEFDVSGWGAEFEHEKENEWAGNMHENFSHYEHKVDASKVLTSVASTNSGGCRYQDENGCNLVGKNCKSKGYLVNNYGLGHCQHQNQSFAQKHWKPFSQVAPKRLNVPARRNQRFQADNKIIGGNATFKPNHYVDLHAASYYNQGSFKECYPAPSNHSFQKNTLYYGSNIRFGERWDSEK